MSSSPSEEIELLERVLFRLGCADSDVKLELAVQKFLSPVLIKITSPDENVRSKVVEVLTHIKRRLASRPSVLIPVENLIEQYSNAGRSSILQNFAIIFIIMGFPRLTLEKRCELAPKIICCEESPGNSQDKFFTTLLPILEHLKSQDPSGDCNILKIEDKPSIRHNFLTLLQDILLLPYGIVANEQEIPPGMSPHSFKRVIVNNWKAEELEKVKKGIVSLMSSGIFPEKEIFIILVVASADTRFSVATPSLAELNKLCCTLDFTDPQITAPLYNLFCGNNSLNPDLKTTPCCVRVRQKLLQYLIKCRRTGINVAKGIQVIFEGLFGETTNQKCKVLALQFSEILIKDGSKDIVSKICKVLLTGLTKLIGKESTEPTDVQNSAYSALAQLSLSYPDAINKDLKLVLVLFNHLSSASQDLHSSIREALIAMAPAFAYKSENTYSEDEIELSGQQHLLLAMLSDNSESQIQIVLNVTSIFLTACFPDYYAPARYLLLLIAGERNAVHEHVLNTLYGSTKKDHINYDNIISIEHRSDSENVDNKFEQKRICLPTFNSMMGHVQTMCEKRLSKKCGDKKLPLNFNTLEEILGYLRICLWYSAGVKCKPGEEKFMWKIKEYICFNYEASDNNELHQYLMFLQNYVEIKRTELNLLCLYDLLNSAPDLLAIQRVHLLDPLSNSLKDTSETIRTYVSQVYSILLVYGYENKDFFTKIAECLEVLPHKNLENKHGWILVLGESISRKIQQDLAVGNDECFINCEQFVEAIKYIVKMLCDNQWMLISAAIKSISIIGKTVEIPNVDIEIMCHSNNAEHDNDMETDETNSTKTSTKCVMFRVICRLLQSTSVRARIREDAARCLGYLAIGDGSYFVDRNLEKFLSFIKIPKDASLNIALSEAIVLTLNGYDLNSKPRVNNYCDDEIFLKFFKALIGLVVEPNPNSRQSISVWLLAIVKYCNIRSAVQNNKRLLQFAFTELLSDDNEFVQDVASRGLGLVFSLANQDYQNDLTNSLIDQLMGRKVKTNMVCAETKLFEDDTLGKTPTGGNITTYKELCSLASDLNQPDMIYQFMQLANHNSAWTTKLGAAFGLETLSQESKEKMKPYLGKIIPRLYRYKYDPTPKIQNSMLSVWDAVVTDSKEIIEQYYWEILREILDNLTFNEWRVRIACCLAVRDLLKRSSGLRLRSNEPKTTELNSYQMNIDGEFEPEIKELWLQLFRVMDDIHEGTRLAAQGSVMVLSKLCIVAAASDHGKSGRAVASTILPVLLETGVTHTVPEIRKISIRTVSDMVDSCGSLIAPHLPTLIPHLLKATGELESTKLSYLSTRLGADNNAQEVVDSLRAEAAKSHHTTETITKCLLYLEFDTLEKITPAVLELIKSSINLGTKISCAHFTCLISTRLGKLMTPLVSKYLGACFVGLRDRNPTVRKYYASAIGHLVGIAKEQSIKNLFIKFNELYMENTSNRAIALSIQSINKRHPELLKDYLDNVLPLIFFAMHEEPNEENKANIELWKEIWNEISPGDAGIRLILPDLIPRLEVALSESSWPRKAQSANAIKTIAIRMNNTIDKIDRYCLINILLNGLQGRTFQGKECLLYALASLCKGLDKEDEICVKIIEVAMKECRKEEPKYRTLALVSLGNILEELEADRFEEVYQMVWYLIEEKRLKQLEDDIPDTEEELSLDERNKRAQILNKLKETICETLGKAWPKKSIETQEKFQLKFAERCTECLKNNTRAVQVSLLCALTKFIERLQIFEVDITNSLENVEEKKLKVDTVELKFNTITKICSFVLSAINYASDFPHTGLKKECLNIFLILTKRLTSIGDMKNLEVVKKMFESNLPKYQKESAPEIRCRINDMEEKLTKLSGIQANIQL